MTKIEIENSSFTILGAGRSGIGVARLLKKSGAKVFLSDGSSKDNLKYIDEELLKCDEIDYELGRHSDKIYENKIFIKSPGISPDNEIIVNAKELGKKIYSEIEAAYWFCEGQVIAITGTNGKTTTTILTGEIFKKAGIDVKVCGNVGLAFSEIVNEVRRDTVVVLEASSYQLFDTEEFKPKVSVLMNITPDHLDWHKGFENYLKAKLKILKNQTEEDIAVVNYDDITFREAVKDFKVKKTFFSIKENLMQEGIDSGSFIDGEKIIYFDKTKNIHEEIMETREINIRGNHNLYNSLAAIISARAFEIKKEVIKETLKTFKGVEHRIEFVRELNGVKFYNDSKATNIDSLIVALESFEKNLVLILGGRETGNDYSVIEKLVIGKVKEIIAIGETREKISEYFGKIKKVTKVTTMEDAVKTAMKSAVDGDIVLLSPACKSFDMFDSYEHRGEVFKKAVNELK
ncbi:MAG: UDP-N-acetylmuramoyl-L-alanine--D-glutamate ligase [Ignavibacteria bacterium]|nr:UDP-N-acetylmuramoyl-L-alanine--D-glutamate ligase [Ignavibacteria bacterium]